MDIISRVRISMNAVLFGSNGFKKETIYIDRNTLFIPDITFDDGEEVYVAQVGDDSIDIGKSEAFIYQTPVAEN